MPVLKIYLQYKDTVHLWLWAHCYYERTCHSSCASCLGFVKVVEVSGLQDIQLYETQPYSWVQS